MNRVNRFIDCYFHKDVAFLWDVYCHMERLQTFRNPYCEVPEQIIFPFSDSRGEFLPTPAGVDKGTWRRFVGLLADGFRDGSTFPLETWTMAGFCSAPRVYCPSVDDFLTLSRTETNVTFENYRQPFDTFCVQIPEGVYTEKLFEFGTPACIIGRYSPVGKIMSMMIFGTDGTRADLNLNVFFTWPGDRGERSIESLFQESESRPLTDRFEFRPGAEPLNESETELLDRCKRAFFNSCLLLSRYGMRTTGQSPAVAGYHKTIDNPRAPRGAVEDAMRRLARTPTGYTIEQRVTFRRHVTAGVDGSHGHTAATVAPHIRRGHWRNVPYGPLGNAVVAGEDTLDKLANVSRPTRPRFIPEVFVNAHLFGTGAIRVVYS